MIVEATARGLEVECSVLGPTARAAGVASRARSCSLKGDGWYDYEAKYARRRDGAVVPPRISDAARRAGAGAGGRGVPAAPAAAAWRGSDFFVDGDEVLLNELNTMPGFTADERLREALGGERAGRPRHLSTGSWRSRWSGTRGSARHRF